MRKPVIGIVGLGVMGASFAARLTELGYTVIGMDLDESAVSAALEKGMIQKGGSNFASLLPECEVIIFCIYPSLLAGWLEQWQSFMKPGTLILEISGVKRAVMEPVHQILRNDLEVLSIHPMCGREARGIAFSNPRIFDQANFLIIPTDANKQASINFARNLAEQLGCSNISSLDAQSHDAMIAFLSQLTHVIAVCLMNTHENSHLVEYTGDSFRDLTRIARINEDMWSELFLLNKDLLLDEISQFQDSIALFKKALEEEDVQTMKELFIQSTKRRELFG